MKRPSAKGAVKKPARRPASKLPKLPTLRGIVEMLMKALGVGKPYRKLLFLMRGPPGSGKSSTARLLLQRLLQAQGVRWGAEGSVALARAFVLSTDDYFTKVDEEGGSLYEFDPSRLRELHGKNQKRCLDAMELCRTPLFVDNTNMAIWELSSYVSLAEEHGYGVMIVGPEQLGPGALDLSVLSARCAGREGKEIPQEALQRMLARYEQLPEGLSGRLWPPGSEELVALREAKAQPRPRYAGLDVGALEELWELDPGQLFWEGSGLSGRPLRLARELPGRRSPPLPHVTVRFWGQGPVPPEVEPLLGASFCVRVTGLVYLRGGGLLCATCALAPDAHATLASVAAPNWRPHITLLWSEKWRAASSNDLLAAMEDAVSDASTQLDPATQGSEVVMEGPGALQVLRARMGSEQLDLVVLQLASELELGSCELRLF